MACDKCFTLNRQIDIWQPKKNGALQKTHIAKKLWSWDFKIELFPLQSDKTISFLNLIIGVQAALTQQWFGSTLEAVSGGVLYKMLFLEIFQYLQENTCVGV